MKFPCESVVNGSTTGLSLARIRDLSLAEAHAATIYGMSNDGCPLAMRRVWPRSAAATAIPKDSVCHHQGRRKPINELHETRRERTLFERTLLMYLSTYRRTIDALTRRLPPMVAAVSGVQKWLSGA